MEVAVGPPRSLRLFLFILPLETIVPENAQLVRYLSLVKHLDFNRFRIHFLEQGHVALRPLDSAILNNKQSTPSPARVVKAVRKATMGGWSKYSHARSREKSTKWDSSVPRPKLPRGHFCFLSHMLRSA